MNTAYDHYIYTLLEPNSKPIRTGAIGGSYKSLEVTGPSNDPFANMTEAEQERYRDEWNEKMIKEYEDKGLI